MKAILSLSLLLSLCICGGAQASPGFESKVKYPQGPVALEVKDTPELSVMFDHKAHGEVGCTVCHHKPRCAICHYNPKDKQSPYASCSAAGCHQDEGRSLDPQSRFMAFHDRDSARSCFGCHVAEGRTDGCRPCHDKAPAK